MKRSPVLAALALAGLLLTGCAADGAGGAASPTAESGKAGMDGSAAEDRPDTAAGGSGGRAEPAAPPTAGTPLGRVAPVAALIRTGDLSVVVDDVRAAADEAARLVRGAGGSVESEERGSDEQFGSAVLRLRVPPEAFDDTLRDVAALGDERGRRLGSTDVTDQVVDLDSRLSTQRASVERVRALLAEADTLGEVVQVESELTRRTADLESLQARRAALTGQVELSTLTLRLTAKGSPAVGPGKGLGFQDGLREGWEALTAVGRAAGVTAGVLVPFSPLVAVGVFLLWQLRVRSRRTA